MYVNCVNNFCTWFYSIHLRRRIFVQKYRLFVHKNSAIYNSAIKSCLYKVHIFACTKSGKMSFAIIHRLVLSSCRSRINIDPSWGVATSSRVLQMKPAMVRTEFSTHVCKVHRRLFHSSTIVQLQKNKLKENATDVRLEGLSTLQIKNRPRRNKAVIDDKVPKPDVGLHFSVRN